MNPIIMMFINNYCVIQDECNSRVDVQSRVFSGTAVLQGAFLNPINTPSYHFLCFQDDKKNNPESPPTTAAQHCSISLVRAPDKCNITKKIDGQFVGHSIRVL